MRARRTWIAIAVLAVPLMLGAQCTLPPVATPGTSTALELVTAYPMPSGYFLQLSLRVDTDQSFQAIDVTLDWQGDSLRLRPLLDPEFDDDGVALNGPLPLEVAAPPYQLADLRHGDAAVTGSVGLLNVWLRAPTGGDSEVTATVTLARPDGSLVQAGSDTLVFSEAELP